MEATNWSFERDVDVAIVDLVDDADEDDDEDEDLYEVKLEEGGGDIVLAWDVDM